MLEDMLPPEDDFCHAVYVAFFFFTLFVLAGGGVGFERVYLSLESHSPRLYAVSTHHVKEFSSASKSTSACRLLAALVLPFPVTPILQCQTSVSRFIFLLKSPKSDTLNIMAKTIRDVSFFHVPCVSLASFLC